MKRLCIYLTYDKQGIVDRYIGYMLKELKECVDNLTVVCNEPAIVKGEEMLEEYADRIFFRENIGLDAGGFKDALCSMIGWNEVLDYDELVLVNDSFFGPFKPMRDIFEEMDNREVDFWGLIKHAECGGKDKVYCPEHIQSFFITVRHRMLHCTEFREYWEDMPYFRTFAETVREHEMRFTQFFSRLGYEYACVADSDVNDSECIANNFVQYSTLSYELIRKRNFPFFKKQQLSYDNLDCQTQENPRQVLTYVDRETAYDVGMIWENLIRTMDLSDLYRSLHLHYVIPDMESRQDKFEDIAVVIEAKYPEAAEYVLEYLERVKDYVEIKVFGTDQNVLEKYIKEGYSCLCASCMPYGCLASKPGRYKLICFLQDADVTGKVEPSCVGKSFLYHVWDNLLKDKDYIHAVSRLFEREHRLGILSPPGAVFGKYYGQLGKRWNAEDYKEARRKIQEMGLECQLSVEKKPPFTGNNFWIRGEILEKLEQIQHDGSRDYSCLWCYIVQNYGFYAGTVESGDCAAMPEINLQNYLSRVNDQVRRQCGEFTDFLGLQKQMMKGVVEAFCQKYEHIYIYGVGAMAKKYRDIICRAEGYVVSDGQPKTYSQVEEKIYYLSEIKWKEKTGLVVCMDEKNQMQVIPLLEQQGWNHRYICI